MEIVAHGLSAAAAAIIAKRAAKQSIRVGWTALWAVFPDLLAFGPSLAAGLWLRLSGKSSLELAEGHVLPHVHVGLPLYQAGHSLIVFLLVFAITSMLARRIVFAVLGWLLHIVIDIPTHSLSYHATRFLWPISDYRIDGIAWWTPWFWAATYGVLGVVYFLLWKKGWIPAVALSPGATGQRQECALAETGCDAAPRMKRYPSDKAEA